MIIRDAAAADFVAITEIYNSVVASSTAIYNDTPVSVESRIAWWRERVEAGFPVLVAEAADASGAGLLGFASYGPFRSGNGYRFTVEGTIHVREGERGHGIGRALLEELIARARRDGLHVLVAGVDAENSASLAFLRRSGFQDAGVLPEVGFKFGRFLHLCLLLYPLDGQERANNSG